MTAHELALVEEARAWADGGSWSSAALQPVTDVARRALDRALAVPTVRGAVRRATDRLVEGIDDAIATAPLLPPVGQHPLDAHDRVDLLDAADEHAWTVRQGHVQRLAARGAVTGAMSVNLVGALAALATDVTTMTLAQVGAVAEVLAGYGVTDLRNTSIAVLVLAGEAEPEARRAGLLAAAGYDVVPPHGEDDVADVLAEQAGARMVTDVLERVVRLRLRQRAVGVVPVLGAAAGAVTAGWMTGRACDAARHVGRLHVLRAHVDLPPAALALPPGDDGS